MPTTVMFGRRGAANTFRNKVEQYLAPSDDRRTKTVVFINDTPEEILQRATEAAADSRRGERDKAGQSELTRREREELDFSRPGVNVPKARAIKAIAEQEGVDDWMAFADFTLTVDENRQIMKKAAREGGGARDQLAQDKRQVERQAQARQARQGQVRQAKSAAVRGDREAQEFVRDEQDFSDGGVFDISFGVSELGVPTASGRDVDELKDVHEERSQRAQTIDEQRSAQITRDPIKWTNNKAKFDFPGIDTIDPQQRHESRSERAQEVDENERAPIAPSAMVWAEDPDEWDLPGIDTPDADNDNNGGDGFGLSF